jgi:hypothetical protein
LGTGRGQVANAVDVPNDNANWIATANSATYETGLMFEQNHLVPR